MSLNVIVMGEETDVFNLSANCVKEVLSLIKLQKGAEYLDQLMSQDYKFILANSNTFEDSIALNTDVLFSTFDNYDTLFLVKDIDGNEPVSVGSFMLAAFTAATGVEVAGLSTFVVGMIGSIAIGAGMIGLNMIMSALSPTPEFSSDPAAKQNSSALFNGAPIIRNQGGSVPLVFGNPYAGAVLISSGVFSEEVSV